MADYSLLGSFSTGGASGLNAELITKLRDAETVSKVDPITEEIDNIPLETEKMDEIRTQIDSFVEIVDYFDIYSEDNIFNQYIFDTSGSSAVFNRDASSVLDDGLVSVHVDQLAQKDIYQSDSISSKTASVGGVDEQDTITIGIANNPLYQSSAVYSNSSTDTVSDGTFTIGDGTTSLSITTSGTTWDELKDMINNHASNTNNDIVARYENNRLTIKSSDGETALTLADTSGTTLADLGLNDAESGKKFAAVETKRYYTGADDTGDGTGLVGKGSITLKTEGKDAITLSTSATTTWKELKSLINDHPSYSASFDTNNQLKITAKDASSSVSISENLAGMTGNFTETKALTSRTYEELADAINEDDDLEASMEKVGDNSYRLILKSLNTGEDNLLSISAQGGMTASNALGLLGSADNHVLTAQNLKAQVDGINYDLSSNTVKLDSGLDITAVKVDADDDITTLTISKDTESVSLAVEAMITQYNTLYEMINEEIDDADSVIQDKDMLSDILDTVKNMLFRSYGAGEPEYGSKTDSYGDIELSYSNVTNNTISLFSLGLELDQYGSLSLDSETFNDIISGDNENFSFEDLKNVFTGTYTNKGVGVQIQEYLKSLDSYEGAFYDYDLEVIEREDLLTEEKEDEIAKLDIKYDAMAVKFAAYASLITQMESSFSSLELMIAESTSDS